MSKRICAKIKISILIPLLVFFGSMPTKLKADENRSLDLVFCLDLSGSTNGLLNDVRDHLWLIVNQLNQLQPTPKLRIGIVGFSRPSFKKNNSYVKVLSDLSYDYDQVAYELYKLKPSIEKGDQIVSAALNCSITNLSWSTDPNAMKIIFLVGNGDVNTNGYEYVKSCEDAKFKGIIINTIYVMKSRNWFDEIPGWRRIANITGGMQFEMTINKPDQISYWETNIKELSALNDNLNSTFNWISVDSASCRLSLSSADSGAFSAGIDAFSNRLFYKVSENYFFSKRSCDLISNRLYENDPNGNLDTETSSFNQRIKTLSVERTEKVNHLKKTVPLEPIIKLHNEYQVGSISDEGIFHRIVLNAIFRQWKLK